MTKLEGRRSAGHDKVSAIIENQYQGNQTTFASELGLSASAVSRWMKHNRLPSLEQALAMEEKFKVKCREWVTFR